jgi:hypothetical protein
LGRMPRSPQSDAERLLVEHPANCEMQDALAVGLASPSGHLPP